jgi:curved DNA-binding protein CbpA
MADPTATGTFAATPLAHVLVYTRNKRLTGRIVIEAPDGRGGTIEAWRGRITSVSTKPPMHYFGAVVYELGFIDAETLDTTLLVIAKEKRLHGEVLIERGKITAAQRNEALLEQASRKVHYFFGLAEETKFSFYDTRADTKEPPMLLEPLAPAWRGIRDYPPDKSVKEVLAKYPATSALRVVNEEPLARIGFGPEDRALVDELVRRPLTVAELRALGKVPSPRVDLIAFLLIVGKCVELLTPSQRAMAAVKPPPESGRLPPPPISEPRISAPPGYQSGEFHTKPPSFRVPSVPKMKVPTPSPSSARMPAAAIATPIGPSDLGPTGIAARAARLGSETLYEALGVDEKASVEAIRASYFALARVWHPDRLPTDLAPLRTEVESIFAHIAEAHRTLTDFEARQKYDSSKRKPQTKERSHAEVLRDIDQAMAKREWALAESEARALHDADADDADAAAVMAWASAAGGDAKKELIEASVAKLDKIVNLDRFCDRAFFYRGSLQKRLGNTAAAIRDFGRALQINPKNIDAQREVRLAEMRARKGSGEHALGLFGKSKK